MKNILILLLCAVLCLSLFSACAQSQNPTVPTDPVPETTEPAATAPAGPLCDGKILKVLAIGNSFSNNTTEYLYDIAKAEGVTEIVIGRLYIGGCSLGEHVSNALTNEPAYIYYKNTTGTWEKHPDATLLQGLQDEAWDIITMQQNSANSGRPESYTGLVQPLINYVNQNKTNPNARLVWHMTWAYQEGSTQSGFTRYNNDQMTMYNAIVKTVQDIIVPIADFSAIIPAGTAIQNVRTSHIGDHVTKDTYHLNPMGMVTAGYCWYAAFTGKPLQKVNLTQVGTILTLTDTDRAAIAEAVNNAMETPFAITPCTIQNS